MSLSEKSGDRVMLSRRCPVMQERAECKNAVLRMEGQGGGLVAASRRYLERVTSSSVVAF